MGIDYTNLVNSYRKDNDKKKTAPAGVLRRDSSKDGATKKKESSGIFTAHGNFGRVPGNFLIGQAKGVASTAMSMGELGSGIMEKGYDATIGKMTGKKAQKGSEMAREMKESKIMERKGFAQKAGFVTEQIGEFFLPVPGGAKVKAGGWLAKNAPKIAEVAEKAPSVVKFGASVLGKGASEATEMGAKSLLQTGDVKEAESAAKWGMAGGAISRVATGALSKLGDAFYGMAIPSTITEKAKDARKLINTGEAASETGISASRAGLTKKISDRIKIFGQELERIVGAENKNVTRSMDDVIVETEKLIKSKSLGKEMQLSPIDVTEAEVKIAEVLNQYKTMYGGKTLNAGELQKLKQDLGLGLVKVFDKNLATPIRAKGMAEQELYHSLDKFLDTNINNYQALNEKLAPLLTARGRLQKKGKYSGYITDVMVAGMVGSTGGDIMTDPIGFMKNALMGVLVKRGLSSTAAMTTAGTILKSSGGAFEKPEFWQIVREAVQNSIGEERKD